MKNLKLIQFDFGEKATFIAILFTLLIAGCNKQEPITSFTDAEKQTKAFVTPDAGTGQINVSQVNLVADNAEYAPLRIDNNLKNAWGMAFGPSGTVWVNATEAGMSEVFDRDGNPLLSPISIPLNGQAFGAKPTGVVYNSTTGFAMPGTGAATKYIFCTEDGLISVWSSGESAKTVVDQSASGAIYKGLALASDHGTPYLYVTDFHGGKIDVFDQSFKPVRRSFIDPGIPAGFAPFNVAEIDGQLFVTYAMKDADGEDDVAGQGNGFISIFNTDGSFVKRFVSQGSLNSPWGLAVVHGPRQVDFDGPTIDDLHVSYMNHSGDLGRPFLLPIAESATILVGNFGDGRITLYNAYGKYQGQLMSGGVPLSIEGLWALGFARGGLRPVDVTSTFHSDDALRLYFTAGPDDEEHGVFGYLMKK